MTMVETRNRPDPNLDEERSHKILVDKARRLLLQRDCSASGSPGGMKPW